MLSITLLQLNSQGLYNLLKEKGLQMDIRNVYYIIKSVCFPFYPLSFLIKSYFYLFIDILAYNPASSELSYHSNNRKLSHIDFLNSQTLTTHEFIGQRLIKLAHGLGMLMIWRYDMISISYIYIYIY